MPDYLAGVSFGKRTHYPDFASYNENRGLMLGKIEEYDMAVFSKDQQGMIERALSAQYEGLLEEVRTELENSGQLQYAEIIGRDAADIGDASMADALTDMNAARIDRQIHEIREIEAARARLKGSGFGICSDCGDAIDLERLMANPAARRCVRCQQQHEKLFAAESRPSL